MPSDRERETVRFGRYRLVEKLGAGGMAQVFRAVMDGPQGFSRQVVIKRILPWLTGDPSFVKMFLREARLSALLQHPNIAQVYELGEVDGEYYIAMEYVDGAPLNQIIARTITRNLRPPVGVVCFLIAELAEALGYAHALHDADGAPLEIVHRDVSPTNIMVTRTGGVKLLDFGIARAATRVDDEQTRAGTFKGKMSYLSPEQADAQPVDHRSDIFGLGIIFHEALTMRRLFRGDDDVHALKLVREANVPAPSSLISGIDPDIDAVVFKLLARDANDRYQTCEEVAAALEPIIHRLHGGAQATRRFLDELGPIATDAAPLDESAAPRTPFPSMLLRASPTREPPRSITAPAGELDADAPSLVEPSRRWTWLALAGLVAAGIGSAVLVTRGPWSSLPSPSPTTAVPSSATPLVPSAATPMPNATASMPSSTASMPSSTASMPSSTALMPSATTPKPSVTTSTPAAAASTPSVTASSLDPPPLPVEPRKEKRHATKRKRRDPSAM